VEFTFNLSNAGPTSLVLHTSDAPSAQKLDQIVSAAMKALQDSGAARAKEFSASEDPVRKAYGAYLARTAAYWAKSLRPERTGQSMALFRFEGGSKAQQFLIASVAGATVPALFPPEAGSNLAAEPGGLDIVQLIQQMMSGPGMGGPPGNPGMTFPMEQMPPSGQETIDPREMRDPQEMRDTREVPSDQDRSGRDGRPAEVDTRDVPRDREGNPIR
jgi:hypothetical protein